MSPVGPSTAEPSRTGSPHLPHLDGVRGLAALFVVLHHAEAEVPTYGRLGLLGDILQLGHYSVTAFIILSGYCLTLQTLDNGGLRGGVIAFLRRRARRLIPPYLAALAFSTVLILTLIGHKAGTKWDASLPITPRSLAMHTLFIHNWDVSEAHTINYVFWSIAVEWQIYFAFPILLAGCRRLGCGPTVTLALIAGYAGHLLVKGTSLAASSPHLYGMFALGMLAANVAHSPTWVRWKARIPWLPIGASALVVAISLLATGPQEVVDLPVGVAFACGLVLLSRPGRWSTWLGCRPLVALGACSYSLYLVHAPLLRLILEYGIWPANLPRSSEFLLLSTAGVAAIVACSFLFYLGFERPFLSRPGEIRKFTGVPATR